ncbi:MAG: hypothetical protein ACREPW_12680 [Candidatus Binataceae bacterium]
MTVTVALESASGRGPTEFRLAQSVCEQALLFPILVDSAKAKDKACDIDRTRRFGRRLVCGRNRAPLLARADNFDLSGIREGDIS